MTETLIDSVQVEPAYQHSWRGSYRVYTSQGDAFKWFVDTGVGDPAPILVNEVYIYTLAATKISHTDPPYRWFEGYGTVLIGDGVAIIDDRDAPIART